MGRRRGFWSSFEARKSARQRQPAFHHGAGDSLNNGTAHSCVRYMLKCFCTPTLVSCTCKQYCIFEDKHIVALCYQILYSTSTFFDVLFALRWGFTLFSFHRCPPLPLSGGYCMACKPLRAGSAHAGRNAEVECRFERGPG